MSPAPTARAAHADLDALGAEIRAHAGCGFEPCETATNMVPGHGDPTARVVVVGEAPGASEDREGRPFVGRAGRLLDEVLERAGLPREEVWVTNVVKARPPGNRDPRPDEVEHCWPWLQAELELLRPWLLVPLGRHALGRFVSGAKITQVAGTRIRGQDGRDLFPLLHPAAALRSPPLRERLFADADRLRSAFAELEKEHRASPPATG
jgi:DNA polymerase